MTVIPLPASSLHSALLNCATPPLEAAYAGTVKPPKKQRKIEKKTVLLLRLGSRTAIRQRENKGLLAGMWELPSLEGHKQKKTIEKMFGVPVVKRESHIHVFSHVEWHMTAYEVKLDEKEEAERMFPGICFAEPEEITHQYALPVAFRSFLKNTDNTKYITICGLQPQGAVI